MAGRTLSLWRSGDCETAGASTAKRDWTFPSRVATVSLSVRSRWGLDGQIIEFNGIQPHVEVEAVPEDLQRGLSTEVLRAEQYLLTAADECER